MVRAMNLFRFSDVSEFDEVSVEPLTVWLFRSDLLFDFFVGDNATLFHVHEEHATRLETTFACDVFGRDG